MLNKVEPWVLCIEIEGMKWTVHGRMIRRFIGHFDLPWCTARVRFGLLGGFSRFIMAEMPDVALDTSCTRPFLGVEDSNQLENSIEYYFHLHSRRSCASQTATSDVSNYTEEHSQRHSIVSCDTFTWTESCDPPIFCSRCKLFSGAHRSEKLYSWAFGHVHTMMDLSALFWTLTLPIALAGCSLSWRGYFGCRRVISTVVSRLPVPRRHLFEWAFNWYPLRRVFV
jgi:hypothetical protein